LVLPGGPYFTGTISPDLISLAAAATRVGVRRFKRPIWRGLARHRMWQLQKLPYVVVIPPDPSSFFGSPRNFWELFSRGKFCAIWVPWNGCCSLVHGQEILDLCQALTRSVLGVGHVCCCTKRFLLRNTAVSQFNRTLDATIQNLLKYLQRHRAS
jgi:hypothetical protein